MNEEEYQYLINKFGESITYYLDRVFWIDRDKYERQCLIQDFGFDLKTIKTINELVDGNGIGITSIKFYSKSRRGRDFQKKLITLKYLQKLCNLAMGDEEIEFDRYWDELSIYRYAKVIDIDDLYE